MPLTSGHNRSLSLLKASKKDSTDVDFIPPEWQQSDTPFAPTRSWDWANVAYILSHITTEFLLEDERLINTLPRNPVSISSLQWSANAIRSMRENARQGECGYQDPQRKMWILAGACYALLLAGLSSPRPGTQDEVRLFTAGGRRLLELRGWWGDKVTLWLHSQTLPWCSLSLEVLDKVAWITSPEGVVIIEQLHEECARRL